MVPALMECTADRRDMNIDCILWRVIQIRQIMIPHHLLASYLHTPLCHHSLCPRLLPQAQGHRWTTTFSASAAPQWHKKMGKETTFIADNQYLLSGYHTPGLMLHVLYYLMITVTTEADAVVKPVLITGIANDI